MRLGLVLLLLLSSSSSAFSQTNLFSIRGRVVGADNTPLRRARIAPLRPEPTIRVPPVLTDGDGRFVLTLSRPTALRLVVTKGGYASETVDVPRDDDSSAPELQVVLSRGAAISGRVVETSGAPAAGAPIVAQRLVAEPGNTRVATFDTWTDDLGEYRIFGLPAGRYLVTAGSAPQFPIRVLQPVQREAVIAKPSGPSRTIEVRAGDERREVEFEVEAAAYFRATIPPMPGAPPPRGLGAIRGRVLRPTGLIGQGLTVTLKSDRLTMLISADARGCFSFEGLVSGDYTLPAPAEVTAQYGDQLGIRAGQVIRVRDEISAVTPDCELQREAAPAVVAGVLLDDFGEPFQGAMVYALSLRHRSGQRVATPVGQLPVWVQGQQTVGRNLTFSDDLGRYRLSGLSPGSYVLVAAVDAFTSPRGSEPPFGYLPVFYPGTSIIEGALPVQIDAGRDTFGVDMALTMSPGARVSGVAIDESGGPLTGSVRLLSSRRSEAIALEPRTALLSWPGGTFDLPGVPPGEYVVQAIGEPGFGGTSRFGAAHVSVSDGDSTPVTVIASPGATLEGRIVIEGGPPRINFSIVPLPADIDFGPGTDLRTPGFVLHSNGSFYQTKLHGPTRFVLATAPDGWYLKSIAIGGVDATDVPFDFGSGGGTFAGAEVTLSPAGASIRGTVSDERGTPVAASSVVVFADDPLKWFDGSRHIKYARALGDGSFQVGGLPPGDYRVAAVDADGAFGDGDWQDRRVLEGLAPSAHRVTVREGQAVATTLRPLLR